MKCSQLEQFDFIRASDYKITPNFTELCKKALFLYIYHTSNNVIVGQGHECPLCSGVFTENYKLKRHMKIHERASKCF